MAQYGGEEYITACTGLLEAGSFRNCGGNLILRFRKTDLEMGDRGGGGGGLVGNF